MATARVFAVPELLENVLMYADIVQLFALQRVNKTFRDTITESKSIRRRMLLEYPEDQDSSVYTMFHEEAIGHIVDALSASHLKIRVNSWEDIDKPTVCIQVELTCEWIEANKKSLPKQLLEKQSECASWRRVRIGRAAGNVVTVACPSLDFATWDDALGEDATLGDAMDLADTWASPKWDHSYHTAWCGSYY